MRISLAVLCAAFLPVAGLAQQTDWTEIMKDGEAAWDWQPGDLIFRNGLSAFDDLIRQAEGGEWASVGILRAASGDPRVVFVDEAEGVTERMLYEYTEDLPPQDYAVYRIDALPGVPVGEQMQMGPVASFALFTAYGAPYDRLRVFGNGAYYNAELPFEAALSAGVTLGKPLRLRELGSAEPALREKLLENWNDYRFCRSAASAEECWSIMGDMAIITPGALIASGELRQVWPQ